MSNSFLPSGGFEHRKDFSNLSAQSISSPSGVPRTLPFNEYFSSPQLSNNTSPSPRSYMPSQSQNQHGPPLSPPQTRSPSTESASASLVEDWRAYTSKLRAQHEGERAHMVADRARMEDLHVEERGLWDQEKRILLARIAELEASLGTKVSAPIFGPLTSTQAKRSEITSAGSHPMSASSSRGSSASYTIPQESGRDASGSPFYAPAPRNPSRTFDSTETNDLRIASITSPGESAIRVTGKELTPSDFIRSPPNTHDLETIPEKLPDSIDISQIQPELEGVAIKASAVSPEFVAKVLSPNFSPSRSSPNVKSPPRDVTNQSTSLSRNSSNAGKRKQSTLEVSTEPENRRLTMHAGHTPNHSLSIKLPWVGPDDGESGNSTPRQVTRPERLHRPSVAPGTENFPTLTNQAHEDDGDRALSGPLGLTNESANDDPFIAALVEKLEEAKRSQPASPGAESAASHDSGREPARKDDEDDATGDKDEGPILRLKPSTNFGRPFGTR